MSLSFGMTWQVLKSVETSVLQQVTVPFTPSGNCSLSWPGIDEATQVCAGALGADSCNGDSGGPMLLVGADDSVSDNIIMKCTVQ